MIQSVEGRGFTSCIRFPCGKHQPSSSTSYLHVSAMIMSCVYCRCGSKIKSFFIFRYGCHPQHDLVYPNKTSKNAFAAWGPHGFYLTFNIKDVVTKMNWNINRPCSILMKNTGICGCFICDKGWIILKHYNGSPSEVHGIAFRNARRCFERACSCINKPHWDVNSR